MALNTQIMPFPVSICYFQGSVSESGWSFDSSSSCVETWIEGMDTSCTTIISQRNYDMPAVHFLPFLWIDNTPLLSQGIIGILQVGGFLPIYALSCLFFAPSWRVFHFYFRAKDRLKINAIGIRQVYTGYYRSALQAVCSYCSFPPIRSPVSSKCANFACRNCAFVSTSNGSASA